MSNDKPAHGRRTQDIHTIPLRGGLLDQSTTPTTRPYCAASCIIPHRADDTLDARSRDKTPAGGHWSASAILDFKLQAQLKGLSKEMSARLESRRKNATFTVILPRYAPLGSNNPDARMQRMQRLSPRKFWTFSGPCVPPHCIYPHPMRRTSFLQTGTSTFAVENFCFGQKIKYPSPNSLRKLVFYMDQMDHVPVSDAGILFWPALPVRIPLSSMTGDSFVMAPPASLFLQSNEPSSSETGEDDTVASSHDHIGYGSILVGLWACQFNTNDIGLVELIRRTWTAQA
ncbi:hypothetical protein BJV77DRAFT_960344 [Russula vinacea]|nr:hypothetical protein BJV77DRAFT_960344 [Russula vinacea]